MHRSSENIYSSSAKSLPASLCPCLKNRRGFIGLQDTVSLWESPGISCVGVCREHSETEAGQQEASHGSFPVILPCLVCFKTELTPDLLPNSDIEVFIHHGKY